MPDHKKAHYTPHDYVRLKCKHTTTGHNIFQMLGDHFDMTWCPFCAVHVQIIRIATPADILEQMGVKKSARADY